MRSAYDGSTACSTSNATALCSISSAACHASSARISGAALSSTFWRNAPSARIAVKCSAAAVIARFSLGDTRASIQLLIRLY